MGADETRIDIGSQVLSANGEKVGKISRVVVDPRSRKIIDVIVHRSKGLFDARDIVVPIGKVGHSTPTEAQLNVSASELDGLSDFIETEYIPVPPEWFIPAAYPPGGLLWPAGFAAIVFSESEHENIPPETIPISEGTAVTCPDGKIGVVEEVVYDEGRKQIRGFIVRRGTILTHDVFIPMEWVASVERDVIVLNRTKAEVERLDERQAQH